MRSWGGGGDPMGSLGQFTQKGQKKMKSGIKPLEEWTFLYFLQCCFLPFPVPIKSV